MLFNPSSYNKIENLSNEFNTIIFSVYKKDTIYLLKYNIDITPYLNNNLNDTFIIIYSEQHFEMLNLQNRNNSGNLENIIKNSKMIAPHLREIYIKILRTEKILTDIKNKTTQRKLITDIDIFITLYNKISNYVDDIFKKIPTRHYGGTKGTKTRRLFEITIKYKTQIIAINKAIKNQISQMDKRKYKGLLFDETVSHFRTFTSNFLKQLKENSDVDITAPKHLKNQKAEMVNYIYNEIILTDIEITPTNKAEAKRYFKNIYNNMKYLNLYIKDTKNNDLNLSIKNFIEIDDISQLDKDIKTQLSELKTKNSNTPIFNF